MKSTNGTLTLLFLSFGAIFTTGEIAAQSPEHSDSVAIAAASRAFSAAYVANDTSALGMIYSDSAVLLPPNREIKGRAGIRRYFAWGGNYRQLAHSMVSQNLTVSGDIAVDVGTWTSTGRRGENEPNTASEKYMVIWAREHDGQWRIVYDMWHRPARP